MRNLDAATVMRVTPAGFVRRRGPANRMEAKKAMLVDRLAVGFRRKDAAELVLSGGTGLMEAIGAGGRVSEAQEAAVA